MTGRGMIENPTMKQASYSLTPPLEWQINIYCYFLFHAQSSGFSHQTDVTSHKGSDMASSKTLKKTLNALKRLWSITP
jgi:hypothetical protein